MMYRRELRIHHVTVLPRMPFIISPAVLITSHPTKYPNSISSVCVTIHISSFTYIINLRTMPFSRHLYPNFIRHDLHQSLLTFSASISVCPPWAAGLAIVCPGFRTMFELALDRPRMGRPETSGLGCINIIKSTSQCLALQVQC